MEIEPQAHRWGGWGDPTKAVALPSSVAGLLASLGASPTTAVPLEEVHVAPSTVDPAPFRALLGAEHVHTSDAERARHSGGKSTPDLLRQRAGRLAHVPGIVVCPGDHDEVLAVLRLCDAAGLTVVPHGGGTSVVGGIGEGAVALDLWRLEAMTALDPVSRTATLQAGMRGPQAEQALNEKGFTLGHFPQSFEHASIGGFAATRSSGQASAGYGRFDDMVVGLTVATPRGAIEVGRAPAGATGPDLRQLFLGSEGALGVITSVTVRIRPLTRQVHYAGTTFDSFEAGLDTVRKLAQDGPLPGVVRLSDEFESTVQYSVAGSLLITTASEGNEIGARWAHDRYAGPYLRDALLDAGAFVETMETAAFWSRIPSLYRAVRQTLLDAEMAVVLCHVSHVYETGASLYFTVVNPMIPLDRWSDIKARVNDAILANGGTISHHHGVGTDHRDWYVKEAGDLAVGALQAVKRHLDPQGILNPGVLLPR